VFDAAPYPLGALTQGDNVPTMDQLEDEKLSTLARRAVDLTIRLVRDELLSLRLELVGKLKEAGVGTGLLVASALFAFFLIVALLAGAVLALSTLLAPWLAALIVAGFLLVGAVVLALLGVRQLKQGVPLTPADSIASIEADIRAVKGALQ
jgi:hypothetical protein